MRRSLHLLLLAAQLVVTATFAPWAIAAALRISIEPGADRLTVRIDGVRAWAPAPVGPGMPDPPTEETAVRCLVDELESLPREDGRRVLRLTKRF